MIWIVQKWINQRSFIFCYTLQCKYIFHCVVLFPSFAVQNISFWSKAFMLIILTKNWRKIEISHLCVGIVVMVIFINVFVCSMNAKWFNVITTQQFILITALENSMKRQFLLTIFYSFLVENNFALNVCLNLRKNLKINSINSIKRFVMLHECKKDNAVLSVHMVLDPQLAI